MTPRPQDRSGISHDLAIAALGYFYLSNRHTLSAFLNVDLLEKSTLDRRHEFITNTILRKVMLAADQPAQRRKTRSA